MYFSTELNSVHEVAKHDLAWLISVTDSQLPALTAVAGLLGSATTHFGLCEIYDRKAARGDVLEQGKERTKHYQRLRDREQERGLAVLQRAIALVPEVRTEVTALQKRPARGAAAKRMAEMKQDLMMWFSESELKVADMKKLEKAFDEAAGAAAAGGDTFVDFIESKLKELQKARLSADRGNRDNIPFWKIIIIAVYLGVTIWYVIRCIILNRCSTAEKAIVYLAGVVLGISLKFC